MIEESIIKISQAPCTAFLWGLGRDGLGLLLPVVRTSFPSWSTTRLNTAECPGEQLGLVSGQWNQQTRPNSPKMSSRWSAEPTTKAAPVASIRQVSDSPGVPDLVAGWKCGFLCWSRGGPCLFERRESLLCSTVNDRYNGNQR